jgi:hypothetical protein
VSDANVRAAFETKLNAWAFAKPIAVAWENVTFEPTQGVMYLRASLLRGNSGSADLERTNVRLKGIFQVIVCSPLGYGPGPGEAIAEEIKSLFKTTVPILYNGQLIWITQPVSIAPAIYGDRTYDIPCSAPYASDFY